MKIALVYYSGTGNTEHEELAKIKVENGPQVNSVCFSATVPNRALEGTNLAQYGLNEMDEARGHGYTSRRSAKEYREVAEDLKEDIRAILQQHLEIKNE